MIDVALVSCARLPEPDLDAEPLTSALAAAGIESSVVPWDEPGRDLSARLAIFRSCWNYPQRPDAFASWLDRAETSTTLWNPASVVRWSLHKAYLLDLIAEGVPATPTELVRRGSGTRLTEVMRRRGWNNVVVKPAVGAASWRTRRIRSDGLEGGEAHLAELVADRDVLVQPYLASVEGHGERALVWIDGEVTHAVRKTPRWDGEDERVSTESVSVSAAEAALADRAVEAAKRRGDLLYARIDVAPGPAGEPVVMELELIEPSLFFPQGPTGLARFVRGVARRLGGER